LLTGQIRPEEAVSKELVRIDGDPEALIRLLNLCGVPIRPMEKA
jgi:hypothetical protein